MIDEGLPVREPTPQGEPDEKETPAPTRRSKPRKKRRIRTEPQTGLKDALQAYRDETEPATASQGD